MTSAHAVNVDGLVDGVVDDFHELRQLRNRRHDVRRHRNLEVSQTRLFSHRPFVSRGVVTREIDDRLHTESGKVGVIAALWLSATEERRRNLTEVVDVNRRERRGWR